MVIFGNLYSGALNAINFASGKRSFYLANLDPETAQKLVDAFPKGEYVFDIFSKEHSFELPIKSQDQEIDLGMKLRQLLGKVPDIFEEVTKKISRYG